MRGDRERVRRIPPSPLAVLLLLAGWSFETKRSKFFSRQNSYDRNRSNLIETKKKKKRRIPRGTRFWIRRRAVLVVIVVVVVTKCHYIRSLFPPLDLLKVYLEKKKKRARRYSAQGKISVTRRRNGYEKLKLFIFLLI